MIEVGSFIGMAAMTGSEITIKEVSYQNLGIIPDSFRRLGIRLEQHGDDIFIPQQEHYEIESFIDGSIMTIADAPWPGLTPDLLSVMLVVATQAKGSVLIHQKIALLIAALDAEGISRIHNIEQIDRGYQYIEQRLSALGARITRIE